MPTIAEEFALALHHHRASNLLDAIACYQRVLLLQPDHLDAQNNLGAAFMDSGRLDEAVVCFRQTLQLKPDFAAACTNLGNALSQQGKPDETIAAHRQGRDLNPNLKEAHLNLANALKRRNKIDEAIGSYRQAVQLDPKYVAAHNNLGAALKERGRLEEAADSFLQAVQFEQALAWFERALREDAGDAEAHFNRAMLWLLLGNWSQGWPEYKWRWQTSRFAHITFEQPRWDCSPLAGRTLLVLAEQGLGVLSDSSAVQRSTVYQPR